MFRILLLGPRGAGKSTQAAHLAAHFGMRHIVEEDLLAARTPDASDAVEEFVATIESRISAPDCRKGFLLDGLPRTVDEAHARRRRGLRLDAVIELEMPDADISQRVGRVRTDVGADRSRLRPLLEHYRHWAASGEQRAPAYRRIDGRGRAALVASRAITAFATLGTEQAWASWGRGPPMQSGPRPRLR